MKLFVFFLEILNLLISIYANNSVEIKLGKIINGEIYDTTISSLKLFITEFLNFKIDNCNLQNYYDNIFKYSFSLDNFLGEYIGCLNHKTDMSYFYFIYINLNSNLYAKDSMRNNLKDKKFSFILKDLIFFQYHPFAMCLPKCLQSQINEIDGIIVKNPFNVMEEINPNDDYLIRVFDCIELDDKLQKDNDIIFVIVCIVILIVVLFFSVFPTPKSILNFFLCRRNKRRKNFKTESNSFCEYNFDYCNDTDSVNKNEIYITDENKNDGYTFNSKRKKTNIYKFIYSILSIGKNIRRLFKDTSKKTKPYSSYVNDNCLQWVNGIQTMNLICFIWTTLFWSFIHSPITEINQNKEIKKEDIFKQPLILPLMYYFNYSLYFPFAINGFTLSYKFLCHINNKFSLESTNKPMKLRILSFVLPQLYKYILFIFLFLLVHNIDLLTFYTYSSGPLFFTYREITNYTLDSWYKIVLLHSSFINDEYLKKHSIYVFLFIYLDQVYYFIIFVFLLMIYYYYNNIGFLILLLSYILTIIMRILDIYFYKEYNESIPLLGFEVFYFKFVFIYSIYLIGVIFGIFYYELNYDDNISLESNSSEIYSISKILSFKENKVRKFVKNFANNKKMQYTSYIIFLGLWLMVIVCDLIYIFPEIRKKGFLSTSYDIILLLYSLLGNDIMMISIYLIIFKLIILKHGRFRQFFENNFWIPFSRLFFIITSLLSPLMYNFALNLHYPFVYKKMYILFLSLSSIILLFIKGIIIYLFVAAPLKVSFKKIVNKLI